MADSQLLCLMAVYQLPALMRRGRMLSPSFNLSTRLTVKFLVPGGKAWRLFCYIN